MREVVERARELRRRATRAEEKLWSLLRDRRLGGVKFRRQVPIGQHYIADFCCATFRLIIEADGGVHQQKAQADHDENRDGYIQELGYRILRFSNQEILSASEAVLEKILQETTHLQSNPQGPSQVPPLPLAGEGERG